MKTILSLILPFQFLFLLTGIGCKDNANDTAIIPEISGIEWNEIGDTSTAILVIEKDIANFPSINLGNSRTIRLLVPEYYDNDSVIVKLKIIISDSLNEPLSFFYNLNNTDYLQLPENKTLTIVNGIHTLNVYATNSNQQKSEVYTISDFNINSNYKILYANDGQDFAALKFKTTLENLYDIDTIEKIIVVGIDATGNRLNEYGTVDSLGNTVICYSSIGQIGNKASEYTKFLTEELIPYINQNYRIKTGAENTSIMGSSLGGLSAFNIAWMKPNLFGKAGAFSGSFWWREYAGSNPTGEEINQARIMHKLVRNSAKRIEMKFWFEAGANDETSDRDGDGIIDAIDDTKDLMKELTSLGYIENQDFVYVQVEGGQHNQTTWSKVLDDFLVWNYKK